MPKQPTGRLPLNLRATEHWVAGALGSTPRRPHRPSCWYLVGPGIALLALWLVGCAHRTSADPDRPTYLDTPLNPAMQPVADDPHHPRVLLVGDSISIGYTLPVRQRLEGTANVHRIPENAGSTSRGLDRLEAWLGTNRWDVIHFNWGLHDLKLEADGRHQVELDAYVQNLRQIVHRLQRTGAALIWATTTPVPESVVGPQRNPADVARYNEAARQVMVASGIPINDLYAFAEAHPGRLQIPRNVHFTKAGSAQLARPVARAIRKALKHRQNPIHPAESTRRVASP